MSSLFAWFLNDAPCSFPENLRRNDKEHLPCLCFHFCQTHVIFNEINHADDGNWYN